MDDQQRRAMRNPETLASYRRWGFESWRRGGGPLLTFAFFPACFGGVILATSLAKGGSRYDWMVAGLFSLTGAMIALGIAGMARYRKLHPWVEPETATPDRLARARAILQGGSIRR
jgi:hypothetical protein